MSNIKDCIYEAYNDNVGVLCNNEHEMVSQFIGTDLTMVHDRIEDRTYILIPLTKKHSFEYHKNWLKVDGKVVHSGYYFQKDGCQWVEVDSETMKEVV